MEKGKEQERREVKKSRWKVQQKCKKEKVGIEGTMIGEGTMRGRDIEREETQGRGSEIEIEMDNRERRKEEVSLTFSIKEQR